MTSKDQTFTSFTPEQAAAYASNRGRAYPSALYSRILEYHTGSRDVFFDVGTGPGKVVFDLLPFFKKGLGCDAGVGMIEQAKKGRRSSRSRGEDKLCHLRRREAVHWFDLPKFYESAAKVLKPGGTLAMWTASSIFVHPSAPSHKELQEIISDLGDNLLGPYHVPGNLLSQGAYDKLQLPWDFSETQGLFEKASFHRRDWDRDGVSSAPPLEDGTPGPFLLGREATLDQFTAALGSASSVIRFREAHPEKAHGEEDPINITTRRLREVMGENEKVNGGPSCHLLLMRRS
ncbi:putative S-adenosylmethionine-dependent methyltransferase CRG1 [Pseudocercospora fuligena]|uniref:Putative S-adenosylmethionine-dependent methyltransferase CRG1 n=1 Tax=Pseudocercospora fuligena TaxID=685502 RepID=A0A8H6RVD2_9PEZI|nr:putative S-adenosylmethionine-dependent methyltransferase CRG1 [Pseudocercospora fuligena]